MLFCKYSLTAKMIDINLYSSSRSPLKKFSYWDILLLLLLFASKPDPIYYYKYNIGPGE